MSEYWVSMKRYWCERCKMFVKDSPLSRKDHEASPKHQHALQRFLRDLHKNKEREAVTAENAKREADRLNNLDNPDYVPKPLARRAADLVEKKPKPNAWRSDDQKKKHLDELAALGVAMPESYRKEHAMAGDWETVRVIEQTTPEDEEEKRAKRRKLGDVEDEEDEEERETKNFTLRTMDYPGDAAPSENIGEMAFKKKGNSKQAARTVEYPNQSPVADLGGVVFKKRKTKNDEPSAPKERDGVDSSLDTTNTPGDAKGEEEDQASDQVKGEDQTEEPVLKHEPDEGKSIGSEPAEEGVTFKARRARNTNRRRI
ncbi:hypothetical protein ABW20_dc0106661 [Dactylellina cionopaga]|nr:hypothetical protein ABW20_dc0106661 [Dactylellina cionopaga]